MAENLKHGAVIVRRQLPHGLHCPLADAPGRAVDNPAQPQIVRRGGNQAQIGQHVLYLRPVKEAGAADDPIGDAVALEGIFQLVGLGIHPIQYRVIPPVGPLAVSGHDLGSHILGLVVFVVRHIQLQWLPRPLVAPQFLALPPLVVADDGVGRVQDVGGTTVVLLQPDGAAVLVLLLKAEDIFNGCAPELIDALVIVAHHADVAPAPCQQGGEQILQVVGVLILVDQHILEAPLPVEAHLLLLLQQLYREEDQVVKVHGVGGEHPAHILAVDFADADAADIPALSGTVQIVPGADAAVLCPADLAQHGFWREHLVIQIHVLQDAFEQAQAVRRVIDGKAAGKAQPLRVPPQNAHAGGVEGAGPDVIGLRPQHPFQPLFQFPRRLVGEGDGQDAPGGHRVQGRNALCLFPAPQQDLQLPLIGIGGHFVAVPRPAVFQQIGNAVNQHSGLAAARPCQDQQRPFGGQHRLPLHGVQRREFLRDHCLAGLYVLSFKIRIHGKKS